MLFFYCYFDTYLLCVFHLDDSSRCFITLSMHADHCVLLYVPLNTVLSFISKKLARQIFRAFLRQGSGTEILESHIRLFNSLPNVLLSRRCTSRYLLKAAAPPLYTPPPPPVSVFNARLGPAGRMRHIVSWQWLPLKCRKSVAPARPSRGSFRQNLPAVPRLHFFSARLLTRGGEGRGWGGDEGSR